MVGISSGAEAMRCTSRSEELEVDASSAQACWDHGRDDEHVVQEAWNASAALGRVFFGWR